MEKVKNNFTDLLDPRIIAVIIFMSLMEFEIFTLARNLVLIAGRDAWISVLLGSLWVSLATYLLLRLAITFPQENFLQYSKKIWGKPLALIISISYFLFWGLFITILFKNITEINSFLFLPKTPEIIPVLLLALGAAWLVPYGFTPLIRLFYVFFPFLVLPLLITNLLSLIQIELSNFLPILEKGFMPILKGALLYGGFLQGLEVILFVVPFLKNPDKAIKPALIGINVVNIFVLFHLITGIGILGVDNVKELIWPAVSILGLIEIPGFPAERFELFLTLPILFGIFTTICLFLYLLSFGIIQTFNLQAKKLVVYLVALVTLFAINLIPNFAWTMLLRKLIDYLTFVFVFIFPLFTFLLVIIRKKAGEK